MAGDDTRKWHRYLHFWRANIAADVDAELTFHVDARTEELCDAGLEPSAARAQAIREFGDVDLARRTLRAMDEQHAASARRAHFASDILGDVRVAVRALTRSPGLVAVVGLTFALGIGVTGAMYSVVDNVLFKPLPGAHGASLIVLGRTDEKVPQPHELSFPDFRDYRADTALFAVPCSLHEPSRRARHGSWSGSHLGSTMQPPITSRCSVFAHCSGGPFCLTRIAARSRTRRSFSRTRPGSRVSPAIRASSAASFASTITRSPSLV